MLDPIFWLSISLVLVALSLSAVLFTAIPAMLEVARAARSAEKLFDTLIKEFPPTLEAIRLTGLEMGELTDELNRGVSSVSGIVQQVDQNIDTAREQVNQVRVTSGRFVAGFKAAWQTWKRGQIVTDQDLDMPPYAWSSDEVLPEDKD